MLLLGTSTNVSVTTSHLPSYTVDTEGSSKARLIRVSVTAPSWTQGSCSVSMCGQQEEMWEE